MQFTFDPFKRAKILSDRGLDILDLRRLFDGRFFYEFPSPQHDEDRLTRIGEVNGKLYALIWMERDGTARLITTRRARRDEEREYIRRHGDLDPPQVESVRCEPNDGVDDKR